MKSVEALDLHRQQ